MLYKSNLLALLGGGTNPKCPSNKMVLWDDSGAKIITELKLQTDVLNVKLKKEKKFSWQQ